MNHNKYISLIDVRDDLQREINRFFNRYTIINIDTIRNIVNNYNELLFTDDYYIVNNPDHGWREFKYIVIDFRDYDNTFDCYKYTKEERILLSIIKGALNNGKKYRIHFSHTTKKLM